MSGDVPALDTPAVRRASATSADGTTIGWLTVGEGPGLIIVHGAMQSARSQLDLALLLANSHTVHLVDRRGRGLSGPYPASDHTTRSETDDLATVLAATGTRSVFGVSSGAIITLRAALSLPDIERIAIFEPPLAVGGSIRLDLLARFERELAHGDLPNAMVTAMLAAEMGPPLLLRFPRALLRSMTRRMLAADLAKQHADGEPLLADLVPALHADFALVAENADHATDFAAIRARTLLLAGTKTRPYLRTAIDALAGVIPGNRRVDLDGASHGATQNRAQWGKPERVAPALAEFFSYP